MKRLIRCVLLLANLSCVAAATDLLSGTYSPSAGTGNSNMTVTGTSVYTPQTVVAITSMTTLSPTATFLLLSSTGVIVTMGGTVPIISTTSATQGQVVILTSTQTAGSGQVYITSGTASFCDLGAALRLIGYGKVLGLYYNSLTNYWTEMFYGNN